MAQREIPDEAIRAADDVLRAWRHELYRPVEGALQAALPHLRRVWEEEQLQAMRSRKTAERVAELIREHPNLEPEGLAEDILALLATPQVVSSCKKCDGTGRQERSNGIHRVRETCEDCGGSGRADGTH